MSIRIERRRVEDLIPYAANSKTHPASQVEAIATSIKRFGFNDPIGVTEDGVIIEGHGRLMAAQSIGMAEVPVLVLPSLTEEEADLYRIAHNKIALSSTFDYAALVEQLREITSASTTFADMGFSNAAAENLFQMFTGESAPTPGTSSSAAGGPEHGLNVNTTSGLDVEIIWDDKEQRDRWNAYVAHVTANAPEKTKGAALADMFRVLMNGDTSVVTEAPSAAEDMEWQP